MKKEPHACRHCTLAHYELSPMCMGKHAEKCPRRKARWALIGFAGLVLVAGMAFAGMQLSAADNNNDLPPGPAVDTTTVIHNTHTARVRE